MCVCVCVCVRTRAWIRRPTIRVDRVLVPDHNASTWLQSPDTDVCARLVQRELTAIRYSWTRARWIHVRTAPPVGVFRVVRITPVIAHLDIKDATAIGLIHVLFRLRLVSMVVLAALHWRANIRACVNWVLSHYSHYSRYVALRFDACDVYGDAATKKL